MTDVYSFNGLGDLLICKTIHLYLGTKIKNLHILNDDVINNFRKVSNKLFLETFIKRLFNNINIVYDTYDNCKKSITDRNYFYNNVNNLYLFDLYNFSNQKYIDIDAPYIAIHTKVRMDGDNNFMKSSEFAKIVIFLKKMNTSYKIVLLGEKNIVQNYEANAHNIFSMYKDIHSDKHVDMTEEILNDGEMDIDKFENDLRIINRAKLNITIGIGGPFMLCNCFSKPKNNISYISKNISKEYNIGSFINKNVDIYNDADKFIENIITKMANV